MTINTWEKRRTTDMTTNWTTQLDYWIGQLTRSATQPCDYLRFQNQWRRLPEDEISDLQPHMNATDTDPKW